MLTNLSKKLFLIFLVVFTSAAGAFSQSGTRVEAQGTDSILFYNNNVKTAALSNTGSFRLGATETFQATALFQLNSASQGFLAPRMTTTDRGNIVAPATGLLIYNTTTNQFDYYDGAAWLSVFSSATGNDGDWTVSGADIYSGVSGNVGIGTSTPGKIAGASKYITLSRGDAAGSPTASNDDVSIELHGGSDAGVGVQSKIEFIARTTSGSDVNTGRIEMTNSSTNTGHGVMRFYTNGGGSLVERLTILETGNVGIGTAIPSSKLHVSGGDGIMLLENGNNSSEMQMASLGTGSQKLNTAGTKGYRMWVYGDSYAPNPALQGDYRMAYVSGTGHTSIFNIDRSGKVGIGFSGLGDEPQTTLDVNGQITMQSGAVNGYLPVSDANGTMTWTDPATITTGNDGDWSISGSNMYSTVSGNVGIGTINPGYELDIHGTTGNQILNMESGDAALNTMAGARFSMGNGAIGTQYYAYAEKTDNTVNATASDFVMRKDFSTAGGYLKFFRYENSSQDIIFNDSKTTATAFGDVLIANGNVGIGTTSPSVTLDVTGSANILSGSADPLVVRSSTDGFALRVKESDNGNDAVSIFGYGTRGRITMNSNGVTNINFDADGTLDSYINAGNVGIGTTTPGTLLDIEVPASNSANGGLDINNADATGTYDPRIRFQVNGANTFSMGVDNNTNDNFTIASSGNLGGTPRFAITTGGNVGIGTTAPAYKLDVSGEARIGYHGSPDTIPLVPSDFLIVFGESAMHQFGENWGIGPIQGQGTQHFIAQIPIPVGYKARKAVIKTYRDDGNYAGNPHDCFIWSMKNQVSQTGLPPFATASVTGDGIAIATFSEIVAYGNAYVGIEVRDIPELPGFPGGPVQEMITGGYVLIQQIVP